MRHVYVCGAQEEFLFVREVISSLPAEFSVVYDWVSVWTEIGKKRMAGELAPLEPEDFAIIAGHRSFAISCSEFVLALVPDEVDALFYFELGLASAMNKPIVLVGDLSMEEMSLGNSKSFPTVEKALEFMRTM